jgi:hypothetical protein
MYNTILPLDVKCAKNAKHTDMTDDITERKQQRGQDSHFTLDLCWFTFCTSILKGEKEQKTDCTNDVHDEAAEGDAVSVGA